MKENTVSEVVRRVGKSISDLLAVQEYEPRHNGLLDAFTSGLSSFFAGYGISLPVNVGGTGTGDLQGSLEQILKIRGQEALDAIEGITRLATKVVWHTYEDESRDPRSYVSGLLEVFSGLPLGQLGTTPNKLQVQLNQRTFRDRISDLITMGKGQMPSHTYMLNLLLPELLPQAAVRVKAHGQEAYSWFLNEVLTYANQLALSLTQNGNELVGMMEVAEELSSIEEEIYEQTGKQSVSGNGHVKLTQESLDRLAGSSDPKAALEAALGAKVVAIYYSSGYGTRRKVGFFTGKDGQPPVKNYLHLGASKLGWPVVDALIAIQQGCQRFLASQPNNPLFATNGAAGTNLQYLYKR